MIWRLAKDLDLPELWPYGRLKGPKIENEAQTSPKGFLASKCDIGNWNFFDFFLDSFGEFFEFFWEDFLGRKSLFTLLKSAKLFESERD